MTTIGEASGIYRRFFERYPDVRVCEIGRGPAAGRRVDMATLPEITTERLTLRPFCIGDVADVTRLAGDRAVADTTLLIPHPYEPHHAETWIATHAEGFERGEGLQLAVTRQVAGTLVGAMGLRIEAAHSRAELGYWIGQPYWGRGYATEAARAVVEFAFETLQLNRVHAYHFARNAASGRVLEKIGLRYEGCLRRHVRKWDAFEDCLCYGMVRDD